MTIREAIEQVDRIKPNDFDDDIKVRWLSALDGGMADEVFLTPPSELGLPYKHPEDMDTELLVGTPHDDMYLYHLQAMVDMYNGEYGKYQNTMEIFNARYTNFVRWFADTYEPAKGYDEGKKRPMGRYWQ